MDTTPSRYLSSLVAEALRADPVLKERGVAVIEQQRGDFIAEIAKSLAALSAPVAVVCIDGARGNMPAVEMSHSVAVFENVALRSGPDAFTAEDAAWRAAILLRGLVHRFDEMRVDLLDGEGGQLLRATATFTTSVTVTTETETQG